MTKNRDEKYLDNQHIMKFFKKTKIKIQYIYIGIKNYLNLKGIANEYSRHSFH
jgi:hypothetical protein